MQRNKRTPRGVLEDWWDRTEAQQREALHSHIPTWCEARPLAEDEDNCDMEEHSTTSQACDNSRQAFCKLGTRQSTWTRLFPWTSTSLQLLPERGATCLTRWQEHLLSLLLSATKSYLVYQRASQLISSQSSQSKLKLLQAPNGYVKIRNAPLRTPRSLHGDWSRTRMNRVLFNKEV